MPIVIDCDFEYYCDWREAVPAAVITGGIGGGFLLLWIIYRLVQRSLDKRMEPAQAGMAIKLAVARGAVDLMIRTTTDDNVMNIHKQYLQFERIEYWFRRWAFGDVNLTYNAFVRRKRIQKCFNAWCEPILGTRDPIHIPIRNASSFGARNALLQIGVDTELKQVAAETEATLNKWGVSADGITMEMNALANVSESHPYGDGEEVPTMGLLSSYSPRASGQMNVHV